METYQAIALSTSHIEQADTNALRIAAFQTNMVMKRESGFFIRKPPRRLQSFTLQSY